VAGGIATLISGLNNQNINWNPGVIKSAILNTGQPVDGDELTVGQGIVDFEAAYNLLTSIDQDTNNIPEIVSLTPKLGPIGYLTTVPHGMTIKLPLTLVSSHPENVSISFTGDLNGKATYSILKNTYSQILEVIIDTNQFSAHTTISGNVSITLNNYNVQSRIELEIGDVLKGKIGLDLGHTYWDDIGENGIGGGNNPVNLINANTPSLSDQGFSENPLLDSEISAIIDFVKGGGSVLIDFNGFFNDTDSSGDEILKGLNATGINSLINNFGITASEVPIVEPLGHVTVDLINRSSIVGKAEKYTHYGNYLQVSDNVEVLAKTNGGLITAATYSDHTSGGRVLVSATNFWLDNVGILGGYIRAGLDNKILSENSIDWLNQDKRVIKTNELITSNEISGSFVIIENATFSGETPNLYIESNSWVTFQNITPVNHGNGSYSFTYSYSGEGIFRVIAAIGNDYVVWEVIVDTNGPTISPHSNNPNGTTFEEGLIYLIEFVVEDDISGVNQDSHNTLIDGSEFEVDVSYRDETGLLLIIIRHDDLPVKPPGSTYRLDISILDKSGNQGSYSYQFQVGVQSSTSSTSTTPSSSTPTGQDDDSRNIIVDNLELIVFLGLVSIILFLTYKNYKLRKSRE
jgi:hypothetical protein